MSKEVKSISFTVFLLIVFGLMAWEASTFADLAKFFPFFVSIFAAFLALVSIVLQSIELKKKRNEESDHDEDIDKKALTKYILWVVGYIAVTYVVGLILATILFLLLFLLLESKFRVSTSVLCTTFVIGILWIIGNALNLYWPEGLLGITIF
ncbi:tripartite tricarboxylate transporter TctB family protein [Bacillus fonticola]|uniref:tripartite tricarboxylate transporter TctB family protein n=1 Tax=Bacillus fonticola TaxID=2728853 RepID=UPI001475FB83|nr:tripartite tricarboxylate transporter TctB family protein [Bacillus fonticola]